MAAWVALACLGLLSIQAEAFAIIAYLPEWRYEGLDYKGVFDHGLTHLIFFSLEVRGAP